MLRIILSGCMGKMGRVIISETQKNDEFTVVAGVDKMAKNACGFDFPVYSDISKCKEQADVIIDFSRPEALPQLLRYAQKNHPPYSQHPSPYRRRLRVRCSRRYGERRRRHHPCSPRCRGAGRVPARGDIGSVL